MSSHAVMILAGLLVVLVDQTSKSIVRSRLQPGRWYPVLGPLGLRRVESTRAGYLPNANRYVLAAILFVLVLLLVLLLASRSLPTPGATGLGMLVGAASSNVLDRFVRGAVVDFISLRGWRTFNLADMAMVMGVLLTWSAM